MFTVPGPCRLDKGPATGEALVVLDVVMSLHVNSQSSRLHELLGTLGALVILHSCVQLLVNISCCCSYELFLTPTNIPTRKGPYVGVPKHVPLQSVLGSDILIASGTHMKTYIKVLVVFVR